MTGSVSVRKAAGLLGVSHRTVRDWIRAGKLPQVEFGGCTRIPVEAVRDLTHPDVIVGRDSPNDILTSGDVARILGVALRTAAKILDQHIPRAWRVVSQRRVRRCDLYAWMRAEGYPMDGLACGPAVVATCDEILGAGLESHGAVWVRDLFRAGLMARNTSHLILDACLGTSDVRVAIAEALRLEPRPAVSVILAEDDDPGQWQVPGVRVYLRSQTDQIEVQA